jgi:hypothetical protein
MTKVSGGVTLGFVAGCFVGGTILLVFVLFFVINNWEWISTTPGAWISTTRGVLIVALVYGGAVILIRRQRKHEARERGAERQREAEAREREAEKQREAEDDGVKLRGSARLKHGSEKLRSSEGLKQDGVKPKGSEKLKRVKKWLASQGSGGRCLEYLRKRPWRRSRDVTARRYNCTILIGWLGLRPRL